jgi:hypothetical protein
MHALQPSYHVHHFIVIDTLAFGCYFGHLFGQLLRQHGREPNITVAYQTAFGMRNDANDESSVEV